ncbi:aspartate/glutamate racemase family protein [Tritonibacter horizontis]|uniref:Asp/Glu/hydantoin racemase n=1 Tax=Tritonibacter horizontis TaxID=1768241 RepID=A0A132BYI7_9RHOB|nr:aspartate/glutamate racemase family protein [Tritonibacter horizontis]KUP93463.1 Asp/Glu/hydantoin racemase [Tritonibacter horizontis]
MTVILINPNSTEAMTQSALAAARRASPEIHFEGWTSTHGPVAIEGPKDGARAVPPLLQLVKKASDTGASVIIIACFDDTGLAQAQQIARCPVIGIGQASFTFAALLAGPAAVITTVQQAVPVIEANLAEQGHTGIVQHVRAAHVPVLMLENNPEEAAEAFAAVAAQLPDATSTLILGCAGAVSIVDIIRARLPLRVIEGVTAAARLCRVFEP